MSTRVTQAQVKRTFQLWLRAIGGEQTEWTRRADGSGASCKVGTYSLDYVAGYGGWSIERVTNEGGGVNPLMNTRISNVAIIDALELSMRTLDEYKRNGGAR